MLEARYEMVYGNDIKYQNMREFYHSIHCLVSFSRREGGPLPPLEAAACKVPIIVTKTGAAREWVPLKLQIDAPHKAWKLLDQLKNSIEFQQEMGQLVYDSVIPDWTWEALVPRWDKIFKMIIKED